MRSIKTKYNLLVKKIFQITELGKKNEMPFYREMKYGPRIDIRISKKHENIDLLIINQGNTN